MVTGGRTLFYLTVRLFAVIRDGHENDSSVFVNLVKEAPITHAVAPGGWVPVFQTFDVWAEVRVPAKDRVDMFPELGFEPLLRDAPEFRKVALELASFENSIGW